ncbi:DUF1127 domain-containing protein [Marinomonas sp. THO17]|uniref:DUF1127 domain-containing protein n=1 Tax=Marinomonas sp. THO17 TaxID=3149048 RepID=UPI00336BE00C
MKTYQDTHLELTAQRLILKKKSASDFTKVALKSIKSLIAKMHHNWKTRRQLHRLNEMQLKDLGLTSSDVYNEVNKPIWK